MNYEVSAVCAVIPAFNEEALIGRCLESLLKARELSNSEFPSVTIRVVVVADSCTDRTASIAQAIDGVDVLAVTARNVGIARQVGAEYALAMFRELGEAEGWLASTDADSVVPENWFTHQIELAASGADVMIGTVRPNFADLSPAQIAAWTRRHTPGRPNGHVHGANLGVRGTAYVIAGGFDAAVEHEDNLLVARLKGAGARVVASDTAEVLTSGRQVGKTPGGYARYLARDLVGTSPAANTLG